MPTLLQEGTSTGGSKTATGHQQLPWQSALFALTMIAASTALQNPESRDSLSAKHIIVLRSSPFYCLYDTISIFFKLLRHARATPLRDGLRTVAAMHLGSGGGTHYFANKYLLPAIAVLQFIKILACQGLRWTQVFSAMYMSSCLTRALLIQLAGSSADGAFSSSAGKTHFSTQTREKIPTPETASSVFAPSWSWLLPQIILWIWCLSYFAPDMTGETTIQGKYPLWYMILALPLTFIIALLIPCLCIMAFSTVAVVIGAIDIALSVVPTAAFLYVSYHILSKVYPRSLVVLGEVFDAQATSVCISTGVPVALVLVYWQGMNVGVFRLARFFLTYLDNSLTWTPPAASLNSGLELYMDSTFQLAGGTLMLVAVVITSYLAFRVLFVGRLGRHNPFSRSGAKDSTWACAFTLSANAVMAGVYYSQVYDAQKTSRPPWAGMLG